MVGKLANKNLLANQPSKNPSGEGLVSWTMFFILCHKHLSPVGFVFWLFC